jgi:streptogramin lyase
LASDQQGRIWVTNFGRNSVSVIDPDSARPLCPTATYRLGRPGPRSQPQGLALDMDGNVWVAQTGAGTVTLLEASKGFRRPKIFNADSTSVGPWGIAVDGANNVWVADFFGKRILNLCGTWANCPHGMQRPGARISPPGRDDSGEAGMGGGYGANGALQSITAIISTRPATSG